MRARPKVLLCETYEEAWDYFECCSDHVIGVISDIEFPWKGALHPQAGTELAQRMRAKRFDLPIMLQSSMDRNRKLADSIGATFLLKGAPDLMLQLRRVLVGQLGFGDFIFTRSDGTRLARASDLGELIECLQTVPPDSLLWHGQRNGFSSWLKARGEIALAEDLRDRPVAADDDAEQLREELIRTISDYRRRRDRVVVADFERQHRRLDLNLSRIGGGSLGGKARGLAFANRLLTDYGVAEEFPEIDVNVPKAVVIGTDIFDQFMEHQDLRDFALIARSDEEVALRFQEAPFPVAAREDLAAFLSDAPFPLAVRSSSLLEDSPNQPLAGVYETYMLPNNHRSLANRLDLLITGIKQVWASTFSHRAKEFLKATPYHLEEEKMGVIVQRIVGTQHDGRYYPSFAGVARSHDFYPVAPQTPADGIAAVALGLGKTVTDGGACLRFSPRYPKHLVAMSRVEDILENSQRTFFALDRTAGGGEGFREADLQEFGLDVAEADGVLDLLGSSYDHESQVIHDGTARPGVRLVTFAGILKHQAFPLAKLIRRLLEFSSEACAGPVEIEFAVNLPLISGQRPEFGFLQLRPLALFGEHEEIEIGDASPGRVLCTSSCVLGNGRRITIRDILWIDPKRFDRSRTRDVAADIARLNDQLLRADTPYLLIGVGRWGSADPFLGIPVSWSQISGAQVIIESSFDDMTVDPSQGSHFFQNLTSCEVGYFTVHPQFAEARVDWDWLRAQPEAPSTALVKHIRLDEPLDVRMDGHSGRGVVLKPQLDRA
ncbi:MAG: histidine kinase [Deltaproteobacteria bacterium]|nr:histidine kinase [Deltaproteobacteria bacterium]